jgi:hypothetical protein
VHDTNTIEPPTNGPGIGERGHPSHPVAVTLLSINSAFDAEEPPTPGNALQLAFAAVLKLDA